MFVPLAFFFYYLRQRYVCCSREIKRWEAVVKGGEDYLIGGIATLLLLPLLAIIALAAVREKLRYSNIPVGLRGLGITFITVGLVAMAFMAFSGIQL